jgi:dihydrofolate synthase/folylpolyglutamate synthase
VGPLQRLESLERFGWRFGLGTIRVLLRELENPEKNLKVIHVAGSNGKGSTCAYTASILRTAGFRVGLYTSPHLCDLRERFRVDGRWVPRRDLVRLSRKVLNACAKVQVRLGHSPTHFESLTALAFLWFHEEKVDWVVLEVGLGGRLDATNAIADPKVCLIAPVSLEHQEILGQDLSEIAGEKAGILKPGAFGVAWQPNSVAAQVIDKRAESLGIPMALAGRNYRVRRVSGGFLWEGFGFQDRFHFPGAGPFQVGNAALAVAGVRALETVGVQMGHSIIQKGLLKTFWPGRLETIRRKPLVLLDGAHNPAGALALRDHLIEKYPGRHWVVLNGFLGDKKIERIVPCFRKIAGTSIVTEPPSGRKQNGGRVFEIWEKEGIPVLWVNDWRRALELALRKAKAARQGLLITGSLYLVGACREKLIGLKGLEAI